MPKYRCEVVGMNRIVEVEARNRDEAIHKTHRLLTPHEQETLEWIDPQCTTGDDPGNLGALVDLGNWIIKKLKGMRRGF